MKSRYDQSHYSYQEAVLAELKNKTPSFVCTDAGVVVYSSYMGVVTCLPEVTEHALNRDWKKLILRVNELGRYGEVDLVHISCESLEG